jgi:hypothetical protein
MADDDPEDCMLASHTFEESVAKVIRANIQALSIDEYWIR